jgi:hypothetical protein
MVNLELDSEERDKAQQKALDRRLELPLWAIAWDAYSLAAAALEQAGSFWAQRCGAGVVCIVVQMTFATSVRHKHIVMELAVNAQAEVPPMKPLLGVLYDELARLTYACLAPLLLEAHSVSFRKDWADKAAKLGAGFDVEKAAAALNPSTLARAVKLHNTLFAVKAVGSASPSGSVQVGGRRPLAVDVGPLGLLIFLAGGVGGQGSEKGGCVGTCGHAGVEAAQECRQDQVLQVQGAVASAVAAVDAFACHCRSLVTLLKIARWRPRTTLGARTASGARAAARRNDYVRCGLALQSCNGHCFFALSCFRLHV